MIIKKYDSKLLFYKHFLSNNNLLDKLNYLIHASYVDTEKHISYLNTLKNLIISYENLNIDTKLKEYYYRYIFGSNVCYVNDSGVIIHWSNPINNSFLYLHIGISTEDDYTDICFNTYLISNLEEGDVKETLFCSGLHNYHRVMKDMFYEYIKRLIKND